MHQSKGLKKPIARKFALNIILVVVKMMHKQIPLYNNLKSY